MVVTTVKQTKNGVKPDNVRELVTAAYDPKDIVFDPACITTFDLEDFHALVVAVKFREAAQFLMKAVVSLPAVWGDPQKIETYRRPLPEWRAVVAAFLNAATNTGE